MSVQNHWVLNEMWGLNLTVMFPVIVSAKMSKGVFQIELKRACPCKYPKVVLSVAKYLQKNIVIKPLSNRYQTVDFVHRTDYVDLFDTFRSTRLNAEREEIKYILILLRFQISAVGT